jgi:hypothetical protein
MVWGFYYKAFNSSDDYVSGKWSYHRGSSKKISWRSLHPLSMWWAVEWGYGVSQLVSQNLWDEEFKAIRNMQLIPRVRGVTFWQPRALRRGCWTSQWLGPCLRAFWRSQTACSHRQFWAASRANFGPWSW